MSTSSRGKMLHFSRVLLIGFWRTATLLIYRPEILIKTYSLAHERRSPSQKMPLHKYQTWDNKHHHSTILSMPWPPAVLHHTWRSVASSVGRRYFGAEYRLKNHSTVMPKHYLICDYAAHRTTFAQSMCSNLPPHMKTMETWCLKVV